MRNAILTFFSAFLLLNAPAASAQILTENNNNDTAVGYYYGGSELFVYNKIKSGSSAPVFLKWNVMSHNLGTVPGWDLSGSGICDNYNCYSASSTTNNLFTNSTVFKSMEYNSTTFGDLHMIFAMSNPAPGTSAFVRVFARDTVSNASRTLTFIGYKTPTGVSTTIKSSDDVVLFPNPAREAVNVIFDSKAGVKTIAIYNLIGKLTGPIYKPSENGSAKIDLADMPNGVYFLRLMDGQGHVVATRRFIRQ